VGRFNAYNLLAVYGAASELGVSPEELLPVLSTVRPAEGRFEYVRDEAGRTAIVDYAHTPDALKNVLETINDIRGVQGTLITVVGAGGDRDATKRPVMAATAAQLSDRLILTSDNPRSEDPEQIIREMQAGLDALTRRKTIAITDRREAIRTAVALAGNGDIILIAGKGHEKYQEIQGVKHPFDDKQVVAEALKETSQG
ncbi:MAG TPA: cyanophycin synthetase, partial [Bacteroidales bacterium]|nr:cyanophycin synthetase [Bacteroidales bacterium]